MVQGQLDASLAKPAGNISQYHIVQRRIRIVPLIRNFRTTPDHPDRQGIDAITQAGWDAFYSFAKVQQSAGGFDPKS